MKGSVSNGTFPFCVIWYDALAVLMNSIKENQMKIDALNAEMKAIITAQQVQIKVLEDEIEQIKNILWNMQQQ